VKYLVIKKEIDYIILVLKFGERLTGETKQFIETLSNIFAPLNFFLICQSFLLNIQLSLKKRI